MRTHVAVALVWSALSCAHPPRAHEEETPVAVARAQPLDVLLEKNCAPCHDGRPDRPKLGAGVELAPKVSLQAALFVSAGKMPPPPARMSDADRLRLIDELCARGAADREACARAADFRRPGPLIVDADQIVRSFDRRYPQVSTGRSVAEALLRAHLPRVERVVQLDPTIMAALLLLIDERCPLMDGDAGKERFRACARSLVDGTLIRVDPEAQ